MTSSTHSAKKAPVAEEKPFDCVRLMRELRDRVSRELYGLTFEEQHRWIQEQIALSSVTPAQPDPSRQEDE